jgi:hypothetical protein
MAGKGSLENHRHPERSEAKSRDPVARPVRFARESLAFARDDGTKPTHDQIAAHLCLEAVLPAFEELTLVSDSARRLIARWKCTVEFSLRADGGATISFNDGAISVASELNPASALALFFVSPRHFVNQFSKQGFGIPIPKRGFFRLTSLLRFQRLGKIFEKEVERQPRLLLSVAVAAIRSLSDHDDEVRQILQNAPAGMAELGVPSSDLFGWVEWKDECVSSGRGRAPRPPDVVIQFRNEEIALAALRGELDELAATGSGDLRVRGLIPLAEILGVVAERVNRYLPRPSRPVREQARVILSEAKDLA